ncbi:hypothetical protein BXO88_12390 [Oribacterium sp. C9]|uniref:hypothetical protein n=1 Tax=Oribacterium sp. C9 TaxID=1943579 RepID=UPI00098FE89B|nr:hypothetical protein [Oribacterium sp. C9]OON85449.1 hypothetical protein BXO88_12390 [Oribacterium sp. C9]
MFRSLRKSSYPVIISMALLMLSSCGQRKMPHETISSEELSQQIITGLAEGFKSGEIDVTTREKKIISNLIDYALENPESTMLSLKQAVERAGFDATFPESLSGVEPYFSAVADSVVQASYKTSDGNDIIIRKSKDSDTLSHDAIDSKAKITQNIGGKDVTIIIDQDKIIDALWENAGSTYSVYSQEGIDEETLKSLIDTVK